MTMTPQLSADEGDALAVLDALLGIGRADAVRGVKLGAPWQHEQLLQVAIGRIKVATLRFLVEGGGWRERPVLRGGRRASGRVWDAELSGEWAPKYTSATCDFWLSLAAALPSSDAERSQLANDGVTVGRKKRKVVTEKVPVRGGGDGDGLFFLLAQRSLTGFVLAPEDERTLLRALRRASPLAGLWSLDLQEESDVMAVDRLSTLFRPGSVRLLELLGDRLARQWIDSLRTLWSRTDTVPNLMPPWKAAGRVLRAYVAAADGAQRTDLLWPLLRAIAAVPVVVMKEGGEAARKRCSSLPGWSTMRERDEMLAAVGAIAELGAALVRRRDAMVLERYGDDRYEEAQVYLRVYADEYAPSRNAVDDLARAFAGSVG